MNNYFIPGSLSPCMGWFMGLKKEMVGSEGGSFFSPHFSFNPKIKNYRACICLWAFIPPVTYCVLKGQWHLGPWFFFSTLLLLPSLWATSFYFFCKKWRCASSLTTILMLDNKSHQYRHRRRLLSPSPSIITVIAAAFHDILSPILG